MKNTQGIGVPMVVGILAVVALIGGFVFVTSQNSDNAAMDAAMMAEKMQMEEKAMMDKKALEEKMMMEKEAMMDKGSDVMEKTDDSMMKKEEADVMMKKDEAMEGDSMMKKEDSAMMQKPGTYKAYSGEALAMAQKGKTVLFFHASWCSTCRTTDADIIKNVATIPVGATILKVDYDKEVALRQKYGVTSQHTFVEIDASGALVEKWSGGNLAGIISKL